MSSRSSSALARSYGVERAVVSVVGVLLLLAGAAVLVTAQGWLGRFRAGRPILDPIAVDWLRDYLLYARIVAVVLGLLLLVFGLRWFLRAFRPERKPSLRLNSDAEARLVVTPAAIAEALEGDCERIDGVNKARARAVGTTAAPAVRVSLWLDEGTDVRAVWQQLDTEVLAHARESLGMDRLPTAIRLEMDAASAHRVE